jgi:Regulator of ribonuclease activity B
MTADVLDVPDPDEAVLEQLLAHGADLKKATHVLFYVYSPTEAGALRIVRGAADAVLRSEVKPAATDDGKWLCILEGTLVPELELIRAYGVTLEALAAAEGGEYDGWEAAVVK